MTPQEAYEVVKKYATASIDLAYAQPGGPMSEHRERMEALEVLSRHHAYFSRFKPGDEVWVVFDQGQSGFLTGPRCWTSPYKWSLGMYGDVNCFPTREEAQAECDRRNKGER